MKYYVCNVTKFVIYGIEVFQMIMAVNMCVFMPTNSMQDTIGHCKTHIFYCYLFGSVHRSLLSVLSLSAKKQPYVIDAANAEFCCSERLQMNGRLFSLSMMSSWRTSCDDTVKFTISFTSCSASLRTCLVRWRSRCLKEFRLDCLCVLLAEFSALSGLDAGLQHIVL